MNQIKMNPSPYHSQFFANLRKNASKSAEVIVPLIIERLNPKSVVDFGCGTGAWLAKFKEHGVETVLGLDGPWVDRKQLDILPEEFRETDLEGAPTVDRKFDLALSLEVAEHLAPESSADFVRSLTLASDIVVFSAAIPHQGGSNHLNEQWPEYWQSLFLGRGYKVFDFIRPLVWERDEVEAHYAQNILVYIDAARINSISPRLEFDESTNPPGKLTRIHERLWEEKMLESLDFSRFGTSRLIRAIPGSISRSIRARFRR